MVEGGLGPGGAFLRGPRLRPRHLENVDLPRYQELFSDLEISMFYGGLGVPDNLSKLQRNYNSGQFDTTNLDVFAYNVRALAMYEKLGFVIEGRSRENHWTRGRFWDDILMGITAEAWWSKHGTPRLPGPVNAR